MLPEVWVRVSGLPSDVRSDYLTLWGVGTLFGKTLDVDMAYTRKNKVLRTKIGCLDHRLIPADSDMFIRRGFYKLRFEVEIEEQSHEVNMGMLIMVLMDIMEIIRVKRRMEMLMTWTWIVRKKILGRNRKVMIKRVLIHIMEGRVCKNSVIC
jgi:hypothetical protein